MNVFMLEKKRNTKNSTKIMLKMKLTTFELAFQVHPWLKCCHAREHINNLFMPLITSPKKNRRVKEKTTQKQLHKKKRRHCLDKSEAFLSL